MNKIMTSVGALAVALTLSLTPAKAGNNDAALIIGGILGGIVLNEALSGPRYYHAPPPRVYYAPPPSYYYDEEPAYVRECYRKIVRRWDHYQNRYVRVHKRVCY